MTKEAPKINSHTVITAHANADFDALAAMIAAHKLYPDSVLIFPGSQEKNLRDFYIQSTTYLFNFKSFKDINPDSVRLLVVVDTRQKSRLTHVAPLLDNPNVKIHAYDHHPDTDEDVEAEKSIVLPWGSTTAILIKEIRDNNLVVHEEEATILGLGIFEDTGSFTFDSTTEHDFEAAGWLKRHGMDLTVISDLLTRELSADQISILGELLDNATTHDIHGIEVVITEVSTDEFIGDFAFLVHKMIDMETIRVLFALGRMGDRIHLVARSRSADVDVGHICTSFGGGGHVYAASATIKDKTLSEVRDDLFALLYSHINPQLVVESLMSKPAVVIESDRPISDAVEIMTRYGFKGLPVVEQGTMKCVGVLEHAVADKAAAHKLGDMLVKEYMAREFSTLPPDTDLYQVMEIILGKRQRMVPVVENNELMGIITKTNLVNLLIEEPARIPESLIPQKSRERSIKALIRNRLPDDMAELLVNAGKLAHEVGYEVYAVGGFVRDIVLGRPNLDFDLVIEGDGIIFARALADRFGGRVKSHPKFRTAIVILPDGQRVDVATARLEYYEYPAALPTVELSSIKMDLYRRDFTMNALAVSLNPSSFGKIVDFFHSQRDIKDRVIRVLHSLSFVEDPTRVLRAIRFEQRFGFNIGGQTLRLIKNALQLNLFNRLSGSRIFHELQLILDEERPLNCLIRLQELKILQAIHPLLELNDRRRLVLDEVERVHTWYNLLYQEPQVVTWKLYFLGLGMGLKRDQLKQILSRLNMTAKDEREFLHLRDTIAETLGEMMHWDRVETPLSKLCQHLDDISIEGILFIMAKSRKEHMRKHISHYLAHLRVMKPDVSGDDLKEMGIEPGPSFSKILNRIRAAKIDEVVHTREEQLSLARKLMVDPGYQNDR